MPEIPLTYIPGIYPSLVSIIGHVYVRRGRLFATIDSDILTILILSLVTALERQKNSKPAFNETEQFKFRIKGEISARHANFVVFFLS